MSTPDNINPPDDTLFFANPGEWPAFPELEAVVTGRWREYKTPSSVTLRRYLAEMAWAWRRDRPDLPGEAIDVLIYVRKLHYEHRQEIVAYERKLHEIRHDWLQYCRLRTAKPEGGIQ